MLREPDFNSSASVIACIQEAIQTEQAMIKHPMGRYIKEGRATMDQLKIFCTQFWAIPKYNLLVAGGKVSQLQPLPHDPYGMVAPYDDHVIQHFVDILVDEVGNGILSISPTESHYEIYLRFSDALGIPREQMESTDIFLPRTLNVIYDWTSMARNMPLIESAIGMNYVNESGASHDEGGIALGAALQKHYGLSREAAMFFIVHGEEDKQHSKIGEYLIEKYATTPELRRRVWLAARRGLGVFNTLFDTIWDACDLGVRPSVTA